MNSISSSSKKQAYIAGLVGLLLMLPSLFNGLQLDDYYHWGIVSQNDLVIHGQDKAGIFGLFTFIDGDSQRTQALIEKGMLPWWTLPELKYAFWRPLSELTHGIDYMLWPKQPILMHLHSLFYFVLLLIAVYKLLQRWLDDTSLKWAFWIFALSFTHGFAVGWLANRNAVLASLFVTLTLYFHDRWRTSFQVKFLGYGTLCFLLGLFSGEIGVSGGLFLLAYAICLEQKYRSKPFVSKLFQSLLTILPYGLIGIAWLLSRKLMGYGAFGSGHYVDPANAAEFLGVVGWRYFQLFTGLFWSLPPEFASLYGDTVQWVVGLAGAVLLFLVLAPLFRSSPVARFFLLSILLMLVPVCATTPHSRLLIAAGIPMAGMIGLYFGARRKKEIGFLPIAPVFSILLVVSLLVLSPIVATAEAVMMKLAMDGSLNIGAKNLQLNENDLNKTHVVLNPPLSSVAGYIQGVRSYHDLSVAKAVIPLSSALKDVQFEMISDQTFRLSATEGLYHGEQENLLRSPSMPMKKGDQVLFAGIEATVDEVSIAGVPTQVTFTLTQPLDNYVFHLWHRSNPVICKLPPAGSTLTLTQDRDSCAL